MPKKTNEIFGSGTGLTPEQEKEVYADFLSAGLNPHETADTLIAKLEKYYKLCPDYKTNMVAVWQLSKIVAKELEKFICRPHKQITEVIFDMGTAK